MKKLLISPHSDDFALFAAFTCQREQPTIITLYSSFTQPARGFAGCSEEIRRAEDQQAAEILGCPIVFAGIPDNLDDLHIRRYTDDYLPSITRHTELEQVWLPLYEEAGHPHHNIASSVLDNTLRHLIKVKVHYYLTYTSAGKSTRPDCEVQPSHGSHIAGKLRAMACYTSQLDMTPGIGCWPHFMRDLREYVV